MIPARTLRRASEALGGDVRLAAVLGVPEAKVRAWASGEELPPLEIFLQSLDLVADGPFAPRKRGVRVAVLRPKKS